MNETKRFDIFLDRHVGFGIRWDNWIFPFELSIAMLFFTITIGLGKRKAE